MTDFFDTFESYPPTPEAVAEWATAQHDPRTLTSAAEALIEHIRRGLAAGGAATSPDVPACEEALHALTTSLVAVDRRLVETLLDFDPRVAGGLLTGNEALGDEGRALVCQALTDRVTARPVVDWGAGSSDEPASLHLTALGIHVEGGGELPPSAAEDLLDLVVQLPLEEQASHEIIGSEVRATSVWDDVLRRVPLGADTLSSCVRDILAFDAFNRTSLRLLLTHRDYPADLLIEQLRDGTLSGVAAADVTDALLDQPRYAGHDLLLEVLVERLVDDLRGGELDGAEGLAGRGLRPLLEHIEDPAVFRVAFGPLTRVHPTLAVQVLEERAEAASRALTTEDLAVLLGQVASSELRTRLIALLDRFPAPEAPDRGLRRP